MKTILVHTYSSSNVLASICAILYLHPKENIDVCYLIENPGLNQTQLQELMNIINNILRPFIFINKIIIINNDAEIETSFCKTNNIDEIYFSHNVVGNALNHLFIRFPKAHFICYGDAMGIAYNKEYYKSYLPNQVNLISQISKYLYLFRYGKLNQLLNPRMSINNLKYALILPIDHGCGIENNLTVIPKSMVIKTLTKINSNFKDIDIYSQKILSKYPNKNRYLLVTENHAEGGYIELDKEINMYKSIININCPKNSVIFIKSHPLETFPRNEMLKKALCNEYEIVVLDKKYLKYPIELWSSLIKACQIICMSYPVLSLKYLYNKEVIQPMDKHFIKKWFKKDYQKSYNMALEIYLNPLKRLDNWDSKSVLFTKKRLLFI